MTAPETSLVTLTKVPTDLEGSMIIAALQDHGVEAQMSGEFTVGFRAEAPGWAAILVHKQNLERARQVLADVSTRDTMDGLKSSEAQLAGKGYPSPWVIFLVFLVALAVLAVAF